MCFFQDGNKLCCAISNNTITEKNKGSLPFSPVRVSERGLYIALYCSGFCSAPSLVRFYKVRQKPDSFHTQLKFSKTKEAQTFTQNSSIGKTKAQLWDSVWPRLGVNNLLARSCLAC